MEANVGKGAEYTLHFWPYKKLSEFVPFFKRGLFNADKTKESEMIKQKAVEEIMYSFGIRKETAEKVVERLVSDAKAQKVSLTTTSTVVNDDSSYVIKWASIGAAALGFTALGVSAFCPPVAATIGISIAAKSVFTVAATLVGGELGGVASSSKKASEHSKQALKQEIEIDNCVSAIEQILSCIKLNCWKSANTLYVKSCSNPEKYYSSVSFLKLDMKNSNNYDEYSKSFDKMRDELPDILNEYK
ncbi:MAG: hypothetical protein RUMPE_00771 [Eubacteriales bacterium SKADARSKE-1]|nr:hypothetical protein [Eubacteriales bacterium SKADARSKE-1]